MSSRFLLGVSFEYGRGEAPNNQFSTGRLKVDVMAGVKGDTKKMSK